MKRVITNEYFIVCMFMLAMAILSISLLTLLGQPL
jgi:hypothetical protein